MRASAWTRLFRSSVHALSDQGCVTDRELLERFAGSRDEAAFETLVRRHGPMVLRVCLRSLPHMADAEDAFQATFAILARRAGSVRWRESVGGWLHGVAYKVAVRARQRLGARSGREKALDTDTGDPRASGATAEATDLRPVLDQELNRLPEKYRTPVTLCYLEGRTTSEAAAELGWPRGTVAIRLARARELLRKRLEHRGVALASAALTAALAAEAAAAPLPVALLTATSRGAVLLATGQPLVPGTLTTGAVALAEGTLRAMTRKKALVVVCIVGLLALVGAGAGLWVLAGQHSSPEVFPGKRGAIRRIAFSPNGQVAASWATDGTTTLRDWPSGKERAVLPDAGVNAVIGFSPNSNLLATFRNPGGKLLVDLWDVGAGKRLATVPASPTGLHSAAFSRDHTLYAMAGTTNVAGQGCQVNVWEVATGDLRADLRSGRKHGEGLVALAFSRDDKHVAATTDNGWVIVWDLASGKELAANQVGACLRFIDFSPEGLLVTLHDAGLKYWDAATGRAAAASTWRPAGYAEFVVDGKKYCWLPNYQGDVTLQDLAMTMTHKQGVTPGLNRNVPVSFAPTSRLFAAELPHEKGTVRIWDLSTGQEVGTLQTGPIQALAFANDGQTLVTGGEDGALRLWPAAARSAAPR